MKSTGFYRILILLILVLCCAAPVVLGSAGNATLTGIVKDKSSGNPLPGANVIIKGTTLGAVTDLEGRFRILRAPDGAQALRITYIGYKGKEVALQIKPGETAQVEVRLELEAIKMQSVTVTAQMEGQVAAINQQIRSNTIVNVVSKDKIQEMPDQNAAESLSRLPGIAIQRDAGEGQKVVVRGLSPRFSAVTVNGERLPASTDDRSVDLSMISPDVLAGIEVYKALRPDLDGDAIGGSINFISKKAPEGAHMVARLFSGYNQLADNYGNYKGSLTYSNRFLRDEQGTSRLGVVLSGSLQRADRGSNLLSGSYRWIGLKNNLPQYVTSTIALTNHFETRDRYSLNLAADYHIAQNHDLILSSLWGRTDRDIQTISHDYEVANHIHFRNYNEQDPSVTVWTNSLMGNHAFGKAEVNWRASYSKTTEKVPDYVAFEFEEDGGFSSAMPIESVDPQRVPGYALNDAVAAWLNWTVQEKRQTDDHSTTGQLDIKYPLQLGKALSADIKFGGKIHSAKRSKDVSQWGGSRWYVPVPVNLANPGMFTEARNHKGDIALANFIDPSQSAYANFLKGDYAFNEVIDLDKLHWFATTFDTVYHQTPHPEIDAQDYNAGETITAGYIMAELKWKDLLIFMPGVRYEYTNTDYASKMLSPLQSEGGKRIAPAFNDTLGSRTYGNWLPMFQLRIKPASWFDLRLASTRSLTRPDFYNLIPYELIQWDLLTLQYGNSQLKETTADNYDAYLSFYNTFGLFSMGGFYKTVDNIDYVRTTPKRSGYYAPYLSNLKGWTVTTPENLPYESIVKGFEFEMQTNFKFLPRPLDGIVLYANYSRIHSETSYPYVVFKTSYITRPPYVVTTVLDTARVGRMIGQADQIANLTLGYEKKGFSGRLSMTYQGNSLQSVAQARENDGINDDFVRWDLVMQQRLFKGMKCIAQLNNLTDQEEKSYIPYKKYFTRRERYGRTIDLGFQYEF
ncbi:MAG TPA: TonB-dependent receptor [bacterium]|nr:TonB-dependent receptor [bacterium]HPR87933.1 TonB-dependent receptor [bacterium]